MRHQLTLVRLWHAGLLGGFVVAYLTGDEDTYSMHLFAGWLVVGLVALRLLAGAVAPEKSLLKLTRPNRPRYFTLSILAALAVVGLAAVSGVAADGLPALEDLHEGLAEMSLWGALAHVAAAVALFKGRKLVGLLRPKPVALMALALLAAVTPAMAGDHGVAPVTDPLVKKECGECHMAFPAGLLPAASWEKVMNNLANHFGDNAELPPEKASAVRAWLVGHAGRDRRGGEPSTRITETRWFLHEHDFPDRVWKRPEVVTTSNCPACHRGAEQGSFDDD